MQFFKDKGDIFGMQNPNAELKKLKVEKDDLGMQHITYPQVYQGLDVFGANLKAHFNQEGNLTSVNGTFEPHNDVNTSPTVSEANAMASALKTVDSTSGATPVNSHLLVFRENLVKDTPGSDHLAWQVVVSNGSDVKQMVYVGAHTGKVIDSISAVNDSLRRRAYDGEFTSPPANYPSNPFWVEGNAFPSTGTCIDIPGFPLCHPAADNAIQTAKETYNFFLKTFGQDSIDGNAIKMDAIFDLVYAGCPNAFWDTEKANFCPGVVSDDIVAHEFSHGYTQYTAGLIYQWHQIILETPS
jgi:Zn-dependent metalloprotease